jgi:integrase
LLPLCYPNDVQMKVLTQLGIAKLKATSLRRELPDGGMTGLYLIVQPSGSKSFALRYRHSGRSKKLTLGKYPQMSLLQARERAREALESISYGEDPSRRPGSPQRFEPAFRSFLERHVSQTKGTYETTRIYEHDLLPAFRGKVLSDITKRDVINLLDSIVDRGSPVMANRVLAALRKFFSWAVSRDLARRNPCDGIKPPSKEQPRDRILRDEEISVFWKACEAIGYPYGTYFQFLLLSAQRRTEVSDMTFEEIEGDEWIIPAARAKNGIKHRVPITSAMNTLLQSSGRDTGYVFTVTGEYPVNNLGRAATRLKKKMAEISDLKSSVTIEEWKPHDLRRTAASGMARCGIFQEVIERVQNRVSGKFAGVAGIYNRYEYEKEKREALKKWAERFNP